jgi:hypothetical protein
MRNAPCPPAAAVSIVWARAAVRRDVSVELEMGLQRLGVLERSSGLEAVATRGLMALAAVASSSKLLMALAVAVVVVSKGLDALHMHSHSSCSHCGQPVPLVSPVPHTQAQV